MVTEDIRAVVDNNIIPKFLGQVFKKYTILDFLKAFYDELGLIFDDYVIYTRMGEEVYSGLINSIIVFDMSVEDEIIDEIEVNYDIISKFIQ